MEQIKRSLPVRGIVKWTGHQNTRTAQQSLYVAGYNAYNFYLNQALDPSKYLIKKVYLIHSIPVEAKNYTNFNYLPFEKVEFSKAKTIVQTKCHLSQTPFDSDYLL